ncbi:outer dense fiber protein 3-like isoform X2 [Pollicipes pollicipes]|nr:outer dense fiber protein 3-like isoform X2 [Pollicipes pollicipes]XP_037070802.1 outer dense fiber protein 3-like isoform X2 [Pollicipes pollicipes]
MVRGTWTPTRPRGPIAAEFQTPGPGCANLPSTLGRESPAFTIASRHEVRSLNPSPAPNEYNTRQLTNKGKDVTPARSMAGRARVRRPEVTPAPGEYRVDTHALAASSPRYSFGQRLDSKKATGVPAPNSYTVRELLGDAPRFTIQGRGREPTDERAAFPAPGQYESGRTAALQPRSPAFSLRQRTVPPSDHTQKPGPAAYRLHDTVVRRREPQFTFGLKHSPYLGKFSSASNDDIPSRN